jgi:cytoskeletal protein RodZ
MSPVSPAVYRRRRLVFFSALILVVVVIAVGVWLAIAQPWNAAQKAPTPVPTSSAPPTSDAPTPTDTPTDEESPAPAQSENPVAAPCRGADVAVEAVTDSDSYPAGSSPALSISLTNNGASACTLDVGSATQVFTVTSGADVWWRSTDCQENPSSMVVTLDAGQNVTSAEPVVWDRTRSDVATCGDENRTRAPAGGSSYHVGVSIGGFESLDTQQILLY